MKPRYDPCSDHKNSRSDEDASSSLSTGLAALIVIPMTRDISTGQWSESQPGDIAKKVKQINSQSD